MNQNKIILIVIISTIGISFGTVSIVEKNMISSNKSDISFFGTQCPEGHFLRGHDELGKPVCKLKYENMQTVTEKGIKKVLSGEQLDHTFYTNSTTFVSTEFPVNNKFIKKYDNSEIWAILTIDHINSDIGRTNFIALGFDGVVGNTIWAYDFSEGGAIQAFTGILIGRCNYESGEHTINLDVAVNGGVGEFKTHLALLDVYEVPLENCDYISSKIIPSK